eukprot:1006256-Alexandrium_andersonii.AAC.1
MGARPRLGPPPRCAPGCSCSGSGLSSPTGRPGGGSGRKKGARPTPPSRLSSVARAAAGATSQRT